MANVFYAIGNYFFPRQFPWRPGNPQQWNYTAIYNNKTPVWIDYGNDYLKAVSDCPHLNVVVNRIGDLFANGQWKCVSVDDEEKEFKDEYALTVLNKPNPLQKGNEFLRQYAWNYCIYATEPIYKNTGSKGIGSGRIQKLWNLPLWQGQIIPTGKLFDQTDISGIIEGVKIWDRGLQVTYPISEIIYNAQNITPNLTGLSRIPGLEKPITNIVYALRTRNIILANRGVTGILTAKGKDDGSGPLPLSDKERQRIERDWRDRSSTDTDMPNVTITTANAQWFPMSYPTKDLMLFEETEDDFAAIIGAYGLHRDIFPSVKGATFENQNEALKSSYQNCIQPMADDLAMVMTEAFALPKGRKLILDYSYLPIMKEDELKEAQAEKTETERRAILYDKGIISAEAWAEMEEVELTGNAEEQQQRQREQHEVSLQPDLQTSEN